MTEQRQLETLDVDECIALLESQQLGRLAYIRDGEPHIIPLNYRFHQGAVVFRTSWGGLLDTVHRQPVAFEVDVTESDTHSGWSVVVHGFAEEIWRGEELTEYRRLPLQPWVPGERDHYVSIWPSTITGRRAHPPG